MARKMIINQRERTISVPDRDLSIKLLDSREAYVSTSGIDEHPEAGCVIIKYLPTMKEIDNKDFKKFEQEAYTFFIEARKLMDISNLLSVENKLLDLRGNPIIPNFLLKQEYEEARSTIVYPKDKYEINIIV